MWRALLLFVSAAAFRASSPLARRRVPEVASRGRPMSPAALVETPPAPSAQGMTSATSAMRVGVVLLNLGGPERSEGCARGEGGDSTAEEALRCEFLASAEM